MKTSLRTFWLWLALPGLTCWAADGNSAPPPVYQAPPPPLVVAPAPVQPPANVPATPAPALPAKLGPAELEKLVAPVALYPDPLLAAVLPASAYPIEIVLAAQFLKDPNNLAKLDQQPWDDSVKTVARFPEVLQKMNENLRWTVELGQAFVVQQQDVMNTVQTMRRRAQASGALTSTPEQTVTAANEVVALGDGQEVIYVTNQVIQIQPGQSEVIYVPQYNPAAIYGPAVVYGPAPAYYYYDPFYPFVTFGVGVWFGAAYWGYCDWHHGYVGCSPHHDGHPHQGGGHPPPDGGKPPPGGGKPPPEGAKRPPGGGQPPAATSQAAASRPWQPDANRLRTAGTRGSQAAVQSREFNAARSTSGGAVARPGLAAQSGTSSRPSQPNAGLRPPQYAGGSRLAQPMTTSRPAAASSAGVGKTAAMSPRAGQSVAPSRLGTGQTAPVYAARPSASSGSNGRSSAAMNVGRPSSSAGLSRSAPSYAVPSSRSTYSAPSFRSSSGVSSPRSFGGSVSAPSYGGSRSYSASPSFGGGGARSFSGGGWSGGRGGGSFGGGGGARGSRR